MSFRWRLAIIIFLVGLLPALLVIGLSAYLLDSTLSRVAPSGMEASLQAANRLVEQTQTTVGRLIEEKMQGPAPYLAPPELGAWRKERGLDLVYTAGLDQTLIILPDTFYYDTNLHAGHFPEGVSHIETNGNYYIVFTQPDEPGRLIYGGGKLMPGGYGELGHGLASSISTTASLGIIKVFSLKLLATGTILAMALAMISAVFLSALISRQLVKPLETLSRGAGIIGGGNLGFRVSVKGRDEFARLAGSFNKMAAEIEENQSKLIEAERLAAWRDIARRIAHEIRNPLTPINVELYRLTQNLSGENAAGAGEALKSIQAIQTQIGVLQELATQFSTFAKEPELRLNACSLGEVVKRAAAIYASEKGVAIKLEMPADLPQLRLDAQMMTRAISNLIKNSMEASAECAAVEIKAIADGGNVKLTLRDSGPGFPEEKLRNIDRPYFTTKRGGTGLGLVIVKKIIEEHGGQVNFYNDNGAVCEIILPFDSAK